MSAAKGHILHSSSVLADYWKKVESSKQSVSPDAKYLRNICSNFNFGCCSFLASAEGSITCIVSVKAMAAHATPTGGPGKKGAGTEVQDLYLDAGGQFCTRTFI